MIEKKDRLRFPDNWPFAKLISIWLTISPPPFSPIWISPFLLMGFLCFHPQMTDTTPSLEFWDIFGVLIFIWDQSPPPPIFGPPPFSLDGLSLFSSADSKRHLTREENANKLDGISKCLKYEYN